MSGIFWSWEELLIDLSDELGRSLKLQLLERNIGSLVFYLKGPVKKEMDRVTRDAIDLSHLTCKACVADGDMRESSRR